MPADGASGVAAVGFGLKSGLVASLLAAAVSFLAVLIGFTVVPLTPGREHIDAARRLAAGLFCSFTLGPVLAFWSIDQWPWLLTTWQRLLPGQHVLWQYLAAATPFIAVTALLGFWIVAAAMRWLTRRADKDLGELGRDAVADVRAIAGGDGGRQP